MRNIINLIEGRSPTIDAKTLAKAVYNQWIQDQGQDITMREITQMIGKVRAIKSTPEITVWRALAFDGFDPYNYDALNHDYDPTILHRLSKKINWTSIGTSWTNNRECALVGGALDDITNASIILEAKVRSNQVDWLATIWQRCTVYQEEEEIRLKANIPVTVVATYPNILTNAMRGDTGKPCWDDVHDGGILHKILRSAKR